MYKKVLSAVTAVAMFFMQTAQLFPQQSVFAEEVWKPNPINVREKLDRGLVAVKTDEGVYLSWRLQADEDNVYGTGKGNVSFDIYRDGSKIAVESYTTNFIDTEGTLSSSYQVVRSGADKSACKAVAPFSSGSNYFEIPLDVPAPVSFPSDTAEDESDETEEGTTETGGEEGGEEVVVEGKHAYTVGDSSTGDLDGDGELEIVVKWDCSPKDNSHQGYTGNVILSAYKLNGTHMWDIDLGPNIRSGAHYTQFLVYDFDGDGIAEITAKTAPGSKGADGKYVTNAAKTDVDIQAVTDEENEISYVSKVGRILTGDEYFTIFDGKTGKALDTIYYPNQRLAPSIWGDSDTYGNRVDRFTAAVAYLDGVKPYAVYMRGYYYGYGGQRQAACAISYDGEKLECTHSFDTYDVNKYKDPSGYTTSSFRKKPYSARNYKGVIGYEEKYKDYVGQGNHNCTVADVDNDGRDEVLTGAMCYHFDENDNLRPLWSTFKGHGDALHIGDYDPTHDGYEFFVVHEEGGGGYDHGTLLDYGMSVIDPGVETYSETGKAPDNIIMYHHAHSGDTGRGVMANVGSGGYYQFWGAGTQMSAGVTNFKNTVIPNGSSNFRIYWDGDLYEDLLDGTGIKAWNENKLEMQVVLRAEGCIAVNGTKNVPALSADLFGDWREEVVYPTSDNTKLRVYTTNIYTGHKMKSLMYDNVYRCGVAAEQSGYNQPPHIGYYLDPGDNGEGKIDKAPNVEIPSAAQVILHQNGENSAVNSYYNSLPADIEGFDVQIGGGDNQKDKTKYFAVVNQGLTNNVFKMQNGDYANVNRGVVVNFADSVKTAAAAAAANGKYVEMTFAVKLFDGTNDTKGGLHLLKNTAGNSKSTDYANKIATISTDTLKEGEWGIVRYEFTGSGYNLYLNDEFISSGATDTSVPYLAMPFTNTNTYGAYTSMIFDDLYVYSIDASQLPAADPLLDETRVNLAAEADTYLTDSTTAHGSEQELTANIATIVSDGLKGPKSVALIRFNTSAYSDKELQSATLHISDKLVSNDKSASSRLHVYSCGKNDWDEATATTSGFIFRASNTDFKSLNVSWYPPYKTSYFDLSFDVTDAINAASDNVNTFALFTDTERTHTIASKEYTGSDATGPYLELVYKPAVPDSISAVTSKTEYIIGQSLDTDSITVTADFGSRGTRTLEENYEISGFDSETVGEKTISVSYRGKTASFKVTVKPKSLSGITVVSEPDVTRYALSQDFDPTGLVLRADYDDGSYETVTSGYTATGFSATETGEKTITVKYGGRETSFKVTVVNPDELNPTPTPKPTARPKATPRVTTAPIETVPDDPVKTEKYRLNLTSLTNKTVTTKVTDVNNAANASVPDFGTGTDYTNAVSELDGWGYRHFAFDGSSGRQSSASIDASNNTFYVSGVGNAGCNGAISFIPKNKDGLSLNMGSVEVYEFDAVVTGNNGSITVGFTSSEDGASLASVKGVALASTGKNIYKMTLVNDKINGKYYIYKDGILASNGSSEAITGIYGLTTSKYINVGFRNLVMYEQDKAPIAVKAMFTGTDGAVLAEYSSVLAGTSLEAPETPILSGKTFVEWRDSEGNAATDFTAGKITTVYNAYYNNTSTISTVNAYVDRYSKITLTPESGSDISRYADVYGIATFENISQGIYSYKILKDGYNEATGSLTLGINTEEIDKELPYDTAHAGYIYYESDWGNDNGYITDGSTNGFLTDLGPTNIKLPKTDGTVNIFNVEVKAKANAFANSGAEATWLLNSDKGALLGLHWVKDDGIYAITGWNGSATPKASTDTLAKADNSLKIADASDLTDEITVNFAVDAASNNIVISANGVSKGSLPVVNGASTLNTMSAGVTNAADDIYIYSLAVMRSDDSYMAIAGDTAVAKISGADVTRQYERSEAAVSEGEQFTWSVTPPAGVVSGAVTISRTGLLTIKDNATVGTYTITCTGSGKSASLDVEVKTFQSLTLTAEGKEICDFRDENEIKYTMTSAIDALGADVTDKIPAPTWSSSDTSVAEINASTGVLTMKKPGSTVITAAVNNGGVISADSVSVKIFNYYITADAQGNSTVVDISSLPEENVTGYRVICATADGKEVSRETVQKNAVTDNKITVNSTGADKIEIAPVYSVSKGIAAADERYSFNLPQDTYDISVTASGQRADIYANDQLLVNNILQNGSAAATETRNDIKITDDTLTIKTSDYATGKTAAYTTVTNITVVKSPSIVDRRTKMYVLGDSLVAKYYNNGSAENNLARSGWGQVLENYISDDIEVVPLGNSGVTAQGLYRSAFSQITGSAEEGDYLLLESGYNDRSYCTKNEMREAVYAMYNEAAAKGVKVILISPNASYHDYTANVVWTTYMEEFAEDLGADYIDLAQMSYDFLNNTYGSEFSDYYACYNVDDTLHSTYNGAQKWASLVAQGLYDLGYEDIVDSGYQYTFTDGKANQTAQVIVPVPAISISGTITWHFAYNYTTEDGQEESGVVHDTYTQRSKTARVEILNRGEVYKSTVVTAEDGIDDTAAASYEFTDLPAKTDGAETSYTVKIVPLVSVDDETAEQTVEAQYYTPLFSDSENRNADIYYNPNCFDATWTVNITEIDTTTDAVPDTVYVKVLYGTDEDGVTGGEYNGYGVISQQASGNGTACALTKNSDGTYSATGEYPVWKYQTGGTSYYHKILLTGYTVNGKFIDCTAKKYIYTDYMLYNAAEDKANKNMVLNISKLDVPVAVFDANGGIIDGGYIVADSYGAPVSADAIGKKVPVYDGFKFNGWFTAKENGEKVTEIVSLEKKTTLYAQWSETPKPTLTPEVTNAPEVTEAPAVTAAPQVTQTPAVTLAPEATETPAPTQTPIQTQAPTETETPSVTESPVATQSPVQTQAPTETEAPEPTQSPSEVRSLIDGVKVKKITDNGVSLVITPTEEIKTLNLFTAIYAEDGTLKSVLMTPCAMNEDGSIIVPLSEPDMADSDTYKIMLWNEFYTPLIDVIDESDGFFE